MFRLWPKRRRTADEEFVEPEPPTNNKTKAPRSRPLPPGALVEELCISRDSPLFPDNMRMVILECEPKRAIFDSSTIIPIGDQPKDGKKLSSCKKFELLRKQKDLNVLGQLIWGAVPTPQGADALKFHQLDDDKLLLSRVFGLPKIASRDSLGMNDSVASDNEVQYMSTVRSLDGSLRSSLCSTAPPELFHRVRNASLQLDSDDMDEIRPFSPPHRLSRNRRLIMSHRTSLCDSGQSINSNKTRSRLSSCGSQAEDEIVRQVAIGIIFNNKQRHFLFQHIPIVETEMSKLETRVINAAMHTPSFLYNVHKAWEEFCSCLCFLYNSPRLRNPVWLSLAEKDLNYSIVAAKFCTQLANLVQKLDTKQTKFFLSNVITSVLMHHMSWVASVASPQTAPSTPVHSRNLLIGTAENPESTYIPYNPHMAQYLEISGSVGHSTRSTKTVICGADFELLTEILQVLSYFIRCSTVQHRERMNGESLPLPISQSFSPEAASPDIAYSPPIGSLRELAFSPDKLTEPDATSVCSLDSLPTECIFPVSSFDNLGRSLLAGPSVQYSPHFVLSGLLKEGKNYDDAFSKMLDEVRLEESAVHRAAAASLSSSQSSSSVSEAQVPESSIILADTSDWSVKILSTDGMADIVSPSETVVSMLEQFATLHSNGYAPKFLITFVEDILFEILGKSLSLVEMVSGGPRDDSPFMFTPDRVRSVIGCDHSDLRLIVNVASVYYPPVLHSVL